MNDESGDDMLMESAASGDRVAFDVIVRRYQHRLQRFATRMLGGDSAIGADISVGAFLRLWENRKVYRPCGHLEAWLLRTTYRLCLDSISQRRYSSLSGKDEAGSDDTVARVEESALAQAVRDAFSALPETHRAVLILSVYEDLSYEEIAATLDIPLGTVGSRKHHALTMLRRRLAAWETPRQIQTITKLSD